jgi:predicted dehydrogenase
MNEITVGIIGFGLMGRVHAQIYSSLPGVRVIAIADVHQPTAPLPHGAKWYSDYRSMLQQESLRAVSICTPEDVRVGPVHAAIKKGVDILLEKPVALNLKEAERIASMATNTNALVMMGHNLRFIELYRDARQVLMEGSIGELRQIISTRIVSTSSATRIRHRCSLPMFLGVHDCDILRWLAGAEPEYIAAAAEDKSASAVNYCTALVRFENDVTAYLNLNWGGPVGKPSEYSLELHGTLDTYAVRGVMNNKDGLLPKSLFDSMNSEIEAFVDFVRTRQSPSPGLLDGLAALGMTAMIEEACLKNEGLYLSCEHVYT